MNLKITDREFVFSYDTKTLREFNIKNEFLFIV